MKIGSLFGIPVIGGDVLFCFFFVWMMYLIEIKLPDISDNAAKDE